MSNTIRAFLTAAVIVALIGFLYWPVHTADFVWDDQICLHTAASLRHGDSWMQFLAGRFLRMAQLFSSARRRHVRSRTAHLRCRAGPMHLVSLAVHLLNTLLVGLLARALSPKSDSPLKSDVLTGGAMLLYGLHPALIEPVVWISCRFELVQTTFMLLGLLANARIERLAVRVPAVATCFFLAACTKETAAVFPLLLVSVRLDNDGPGTGQAWLPGAVADTLATTMAGVRCCVRCRNRLPGAAPCRARIPARCQWQRARGVVGTPANRGAGIVDLLANSRLADVRLGTDSISSTRSSSRFSAHAP